MTAADVAYAVEWQRRTGIRLDLAFNGAGSVAADAGAGTDPLTAALVAARNDFGWINHTWSHRYLGCVRDTSTTPWSCATLPILGLDPLGQRERDRVGDHPQRRVRPAPRAADRPDRAGDRRARRAGGAAADARRQPAAGGGARGRGHPHDRRRRLAGGRTPAPSAGPSPSRGTRSTSTSTRRRSTETIDQYNWAHTSRADGGNGECEADGALPAARRTRDRLRGPHRAGRGGQGPRPHAGQRPTAALRPPAPAHRGPHALPAARPGRRRLPGLVRRQPAAAWCRR